MTVWMVQTMSKDENDLQKRYLMRKIKRLRPFFDGRLCYHTHCQWKIGGRFKEALADWNTRPAPPLGRCIDCANVCEVSDNLVTCDIFERDMMPDDFCSQFEAKEREENEQTAVG